MTLKLNEDFAARLKGVGADKVKMIDATTVEMTFDSPALVKTGSIAMKKTGDIRIRQLVRVERKAAEILTSSGATPSCASAARIIITKEEDKKVFDGFVSCGDEFWRPGDIVVYTFVVTNPVEDSSMCDITLSSLEDEVHGQYPADVLQQINNSRTIIGDNGDDCLQYGEQWIYSYSYKYNNSTTGYVAAYSVVEGIDELSVIRQHGDSADYLIVKVV